MEEEKSKHRGRPMTDEELKEWQKAFSDIEEAIENLEENDGKEEK